MKPGDFVLEAVREAPEAPKTIIVIRHSKRDSFNGMPEHLRDDVEITPDGILMAQEFGRSLGTVMPGQRLSLGHTTARRCRMTAESILAGYPAERGRILGCIPAIPAPVVDMDRYVALRDEVGWQELIRQWLDEEIPGHTFHNPHWYADVVLRDLFASVKRTDGSLFIFVAHDITLFPLISRLFGARVNPIEFLNGIVIAADTGTARFRFADAALSLEAERKIS